jgi:hypothetical protein
MDGKLIIPFPEFVRTKYDPPGGTQQKFPEVGVM